MKKQQYYYKTSMFKEIKERKEVLARIIIEKRNALAKAPEGDIRTNYDKSRNVLQFYLRSGKSDKNGKYMKKQEKSKAYSLLQKKYDKQILFEAEKEMGAIERFLSVVDEDELEKKYSELPPIIKPLITPVALDEETLIKQWESVQYERKGFSPLDESEHYTKKDERVRSKSEILIANSLFDAGIPYLYEFPIKLKSGIIVHPDFTVLNVRTGKTYYWEHLGSMDDMEYVRDNIPKVREYINSGLVLGESLVLTFETLKSPLSPREIERTIKTYFL